MSEFEPSTEQVVLFKLNESISVGRAAKMYQSESIWLLRTIETLKAANSRLLAENEKYREVLKAVALPPYKDSDLKSLLETLQACAKSALRDIPDNASGERK